MLTSININEYGISPGVFEKDEKKFHEDK